MSNLVITNAGLAAASVATPTGPYIHITQFKLGNDFATPAQATDTDIIGDTVYTGTAVSYNYYATDTVQVNLEVPAEAGPFDYGEIGLFMEDNTMFGRFSFGTTRTKLPSTLSGYANILRIKVLIKLEQGAAVFQIDNVGEQDVLEMDTLMTLQPPGDHPEVPLAIVHEPNDYQESVFLAKHDATLWNPVNYVRIGAPEIEASTDTTITAAFFESLSMAGSGELGKFIIQVEGGFVRSVESISGDTITLAQPLDTAPLVGQLVIIYELSTVQRNGDGFAGYPAVTNIADFTVTNASPVNENGDTLYQFSTNTGGYNTRPSNCYMTFQMQTAGYFEGSGSGETGHIVIGTRYEAVTDLPRAEAVLFSRGVPAPVDDATRIAPSVQMEEVSPGTSPVDRRFMFPGTDSPYKTTGVASTAANAAFGINDGVLYKVEVWTREFREGVYTSRFKLYEQASNGYDWNLLRDTGDVVVNQDAVLDFSASDVFFAEVADPGGTWSIQYSNIKVIWTPNADTVGPDLTNVLQRTGGTFSGVYQAKENTIVDYSTPWNRIKLNNDLEGDNEGDPIDLRRWTAFINGNPEVGTSLLVTGTSKNLEDNGTGGSNKKGANLTVINQHVDVLANGVAPYLSVSYGVRDFAIHPSLDVNSHGNVVVFPAFGHANASWVVTIVHSGGTAAHEFNEKGLRLRAHESSTLVTPNGRTLGDPSLRMRGVENTGGPNASAFAEFEVDPPFNMENFCAVGAIGAFLGGAPSGGQIENIVRPLYCLVSNVIRELREVKLLATAESGNN